MKLRRTYNKSLIMKKANAKIAAEVEIKAACENYLVGIVA